MADRYNDVAQKNALATEYSNKLQKKEEKLKNSLSDTQYTFLKTPWVLSENPIYTEFSSAMKDPDTVLSEYISKKLGWLFKDAIPSREKDVILYFADRIQEYPYSDTILRRSYKSKNNKEYIYKFSHLIKDYCDQNSIIIDEDLDKILNRELPEDAQAYLDKFSFKGCGYTGWQIAYALDHNNKKVEDAVRRILTEENSSSMLTTELVRGIFISHRSDFYELLGKLLLAAKLQEGLRQVICENADCGTKEGFLTILKVIEENELIRFSSVKRAVGTWLGILTPEVRDLERISEKSVRLIIDCIESKSVREEYLTSEDSMKIYIALWSYGLDDVYEAIQKITHISINGSTHQLLVAGYFAASLNLSSVSNKIAKTVLKQNCDKDDVLAVWLPLFIPRRIYSFMHSVINNQSVDFESWFDSKEEVSTFYHLFKKLYYICPDKKKIISPCIFPWYEASFSKSDFAEILCTLSLVSEEDKKIDEACALIKECSADNRESYLSALLCSPKTPIQRNTVFESLTDKETDTRRSAYKIISKMELTSDEYLILEEHLRFKGADIRKYVIEILLKQSDSKLSECILRLLESDKEEVRLGGLDMLLQLKNDKKRSNIADSFKSILSKMATSGSLTSKEKILLDSLVPEKTETINKPKPLFSPEDKYLPSEFNEDYIKHCINTFSEYFPDSKLPELVGGKKGKFNLFGKIKSAITDSAFCPSALLAANDLISLSKLIELHKTDTFICSSGEEVLIGNVQYPLDFWTKDGNIPLMELWQEWINTNGITNQRLFRAILLSLAYKEKDQFSKSCADTIRTVFGAGFEWGKELPYHFIIKAVLDHLLKTLPNEDLYKLASALTLWFIRCVPDNMVMLRVPTQNAFFSQHQSVHLLGHKQLCFIYSMLDCKNNSELKNIFPLAAASSERCMAEAKKVYKKEMKAGNTYSHIYNLRFRTLSQPIGSSYGSGILPANTYTYLYAAYQGIITKAQLFEFLFDSDNIRNTLETVTSIASIYYENGKLIASRDSYSAFRNSRKLESFIGKKDEPDEEDMKLLRFVADVYETIIPVILSSELSRGDSPSTYTEGIFNINRIYGTKYFSEILAALGNDTIDRVKHYSPSYANDRKASLSHLLSVCIPSDGDSEETLRTALKGKKISKKRLIEAALFSPEWIPIIGKYLEIEYFESVCYYFMAHMNEEFDDKRKAMIAKFTPLTDEELNLGAFDVNWFRFAYDSIGEKEFNLVYDAAKYITSGIKHSRARKYADASLGKLDVEETEKTITDKRNKDLLMAYSLIPLEGEDDICRRYLYIQKFKKESKQFGSQRSSNEGKAVEMALTNLAINAGYSDTIRLTLRMETKVIDDNRALLEEQIIDGVSFVIALDKEGKATLTSEKDGKKLKSIPAKLKKNDTVLELNNLVKKLNEQYRRTRIMLESAMEDCTAFTFGEFSALSTHPVVYPMLKNLVLISDSSVGFLSDEGLVDDMGTVYKLSDSSKIKVAHPFDLYSRGCWRNYQKYLFDNKISQPFRQVFRELYIKTEEEQDMFHSLRYAGNQIQPAKTVSVLKGRRWLADVEFGLQKVYYKENIVAQMYALADWFSPADIEAPTLEWVCFSDRKTGNELKISDVPDIVFSEVMRDVDLAVSVAHAGGVDPETSHSTMDMRSAILSFVLPMFRISNVKIENRHAIVEGKLADYSIHLGSGVVHQIGGTMIPVLPVHSQHRGKIFLPFVDDDPKTAEIISKILLFAEDDKIKDPMILSSISK